MRLKDLVAILQNELESYKDKDVIVNCNWEGHSYKLKDITIAADDNNIILRVQGNKQ